MKLIVGGLVGLGVLMAILGYGYWSLVYVDETNLLTFLSPEGVTRLSVLDARDALVWQIEPASPKHLKTIHFGEVPPGFVQRVPKQGGRPHRLVPGELVTLRVDAVTRYQEHRCTATGVASVSCGTYVQGPVGEAAPK